MFGCLGNGHIGPRKEFSNFHPFFHLGTTGNCLRRRNLQDKFWLNVCFNELTYSYYHVVVIIFYILGAKKTTHLPYYGSYQLHNPILMINDVDLVRHIFVKDFEYFVDRNGPVLRNAFHTGTETDKIWGKQMTFATGDDWKNLRTTFSPIFTSGKMKAMLIFMQETCNQLLESIDKHIQKKEDFELKDMLGKYSMETIASCAFGVNPDSFNNSNSKFVEYANTIFQQSFTDVLKFLTAVAIPGGRQVLKAFGISIFKEVNTQFFYKVLKTTLDHRRETKTRRNDLVDMMVDAIKGDINHNDEEGEQFEKDAKLNYKGSKSFDEVDIVATALVLLVAGYDTTGTTLAYALYELAKNPEIQDRLQSEIDEVTNGDAEKTITYEDLQNMTYLDQVISETLRFHTLLPMLQRSTNKEYKLPGYDLVIPENTELMINVMAIHFDPKHYADPNNFNPDHFSKEAKAQRSP